MKRWVLWGILGIIFCVGVYLVVSFYRPHFEKDFILRDLNNRPLRLSSFAGRPIILVFFSPRCGECKKEAPWLNELYEAYREDGLVLIGIGIKYPEEIREFVREQKVEYPVVIDSALSVCKTFEVFFLPHLVFINRQGKIVSTATGETPPEKLKEHLQGIL
ncbi:MAG: TlpA family protein disulfide reductase [Candidatus Caldatribacterium sp.]|nr:TlpA family protein disulfide reductase [Candidatus Caldatribacterium sp.]